MPRLQRLKELSRGRFHWRNSGDTPWLKDAPVRPLQHALKDLDRAFKNFYWGWMASIPHYRNTFYGVACATISCVAMGFIRNPHRNVYLAAIVMGIVANAVNPAESTTDIFKV
jgi:hypothetical protein